jgi:hypothetical protein
MSNIAHLQQNDGPLLPARLEIFLRGLKRRSDAEAARRHTDRDDVPD